MFLNNQTAICELLVNILLCLTNVAARFKYSVSDWRMCDNGDEGFLTVRNVPVQKCILECDLRPRCNAVKYLVARRECRLLENDENTSKMYNSRPCMFIRKADIYDTALNTDTFQNCSVKEVRNGENAGCDIKECDRLSVNNTNVLGNVQSVGSKVKVSPLPGYKLVAYNGTPTCQTNGEWDSVPEAIVLCEDGWFQINRSCYLVREKPTGFCSTNKFCSSRSAHVVQIETDAENEAITSIIRKNGKQTIYWIGMQYDNKMRAWKSAWSHAYVSFYNWNPNEGMKRRNSKRCVVISTIDKYWKIRSCNNGNAGVFCERR